jgi:hypothetical protein
LKEVADLLALYRRCLASSEVKKLALQHVADLDRKIAEMERSGRRSPTSRRAATATLGWSHQSDPAAFKAGASGAARGLADTDSGGRTQRRRGILERSHIRELPGPDLAPSSWHRSACDG